MVNLKSDKERIIHRLKIAKGHLDKVLEMVISDKYCIDVVHQSLAVQKALKKVDEITIEKHLKTCAIDQVKNGNSKQMVEELLSIYSYKT